MAAPEYSVSFLSVADHSQKGRLNMRLVFFNLMLGRREINLQIEVCRQFRNYNTFGLLCHVKSKKKYLSETLTMD
jgi:hypothetical protein